MIVFCLRYGEDASILTENAAYAVGNTAFTAYNVSGLGVKSVRKMRIILLLHLLYF